MKKFTRKVDHKKEAENLLRMFNTTNAKPDMVGYILAKKNAMIAATYMKNQDSAAYEYYDMIGKELEKL